MNLTAGTTLQNHKYVIQKQLHQSDVGVTYQAQHAYLDQPVVLQTLNEALRQRSNFTQLRQQFLSKVRAIAQQPQGSLHVLDCFEEDDMPFVVFELASNSAPESSPFTGWFPTVEPETAASGAKQEPSNWTEPSGSAARATSHAAASNSELDSDSVNPFDLIQLDMAQPDAAQPDVPQPNSLNSRISEPDALAAAQPQSAAPPAPNPGTTAPASPTRSLTPPDLLLNRVRSQVVTAPVSLPVASVVTPVATQSSKPARRWLSWTPVALLATCLVAGLLGAGFGYLLRFSSTGDMRTPKLTPRLFSREQSFPSESDWPVSETPQTFSDPTPVEAPVYRSNSPVLPDYQTLPAPSLDPDSFAPLPANPPAAEVAPPSPAPEAPAALEPVIPPQIGNAPAVSAPAVEPAPPPEPAPPAPPISLPPPAPSELPREPQVLKN